MIEGLCGLDEFGGGVPEKPVADEQGEQKPEYNNIADMLP